MIRNTTMITNMSIKGVRSSSEAAPYFLAPFFKALEFCSQGAKGFLPGFLMVIASCSSSSVHAAHRYAGQLVLEADVHDRDQLLVRNFVLARDLNVLVLGMLGPTLLQHL